MRFVGFVTFAIACVATASVSLPLALGAAAEGINIPPIELTAEQIKRIVKDEKGVTLSGTVGGMPIRIFFAPDATFTLAVKKGETEPQQVVGNWYVEAEASLLCLSTAKGEGGRQCWNVRRGEWLELVSPQGSLAALQMPLGPMTIALAEGGRKVEFLEPEKLVARPPSVVPPIAPAEPAAVQECTTRLVRCQAQTEKARARLEATMERTVKQINAEVPCSEVKAVISDELSVSFIGSVGTSEGTAIAERIVRDNGVSAFVTGTAGLSYNGGRGGRCTIELTPQWTVKVGPDGKPVQIGGKDVRRPEQINLPEADACKTVGLLVDKALMFAPFRNDGADISFWVLGKGGVLSCQGNGGKWEIGPGGADVIDGFLILKKN